MEIKKTPPKMAKRLGSLVRIVLYTTRKGISKSKPSMLDLDFLIKRGKTAIGNLMLHRHHHSSTLSCRSDDVLSSFVSPREYEFSCSNTPAYPYHHSGRKNQGHRPRYDRLQQQVPYILNTGGHAEYPLPGFGNSPLVRQLRVTDSPFAAHDHTDEDHQVDRDAEKFIKRFYKELWNQSRIAAFESPPPYHI